MKNSAMVKQKSNQQASYSAITIQKWMDRLELCMGESTMDENGQGSLLVQKAFEVVERVSHLSCRGWYERGSVQWDIASPNPVLRCPKLSRLFGCSSNAFKENSMNLADEPQ